MAWDGVVLRGSIRGGLAFAYLGKIVGDVLLIYIYGEFVHLGEGLFLGGFSTEPTPEEPTDGGNEEEPPVLGGEDEGGSGGTGTDEPDITVGEN